jgi:hypothetical protein
MFTPVEKRSPLKPILAAAFSLIIAGAAFYFINFRKIAVTATRTQIYAAHTVTQPKAGPNNLIGELGESSDDLFVIATLHIENKTRQEMFITRASTTFTDSTGAILEGQVLGRSDLTLGDLGRTEAIFPALTPMLPNPLIMGSAYGPGTIVDATILLHFTGLTEANWKARKSTTLTLNFEHQPPQTITLPVEAASLPKP